MKECKEGEKLYVQNTPVIIIRPWFRDNSYEAVWRHFGKGCVGEICWNSNNQAWEFGGGAAGYADNQPRCAKYLSILDSQ